MRKKPILCTIPLSKNELQKVDIFVPRERLSIWSYKKNAKFTKFIEILLKSSSYQYSTGCRNIHGPAHYTLTCTISRVIRRNVLAPLALCALSFHNYDLISSGKKVCPTGLRTHFSSGISWSSPTPSL